MLIEQKELKEQQNISNLINKLVIKEDLINQKELKKKLID